LGGPPPATLVNELQDLAARAQTSYLRLIRQTRGSYFNFELKVPGWRGSQASWQRQIEVYCIEIKRKVTTKRSPGRELDLGPKKRKLPLVTQRLMGPKIGPKTLAAALAALSMAVLGHFFI
jgi:hypothetical protein